MVGFFYNFVSFLILFTRSCTHNYNNIRYNITCHKSKGRVATMDGVHEWMSAMQGDSDDE
jgi:hypothetical protein